MLIWIVLLCVWAGTGAQDMRRFDLASIPLPKVERTTLVNNSQGEQLHIPNYLYKSFEYVVTKNKPGWAVYAAAQSQCNDNSAYSDLFVRAATYIHIVDLLLHNQTKEKIALFKQVSDGDEMKCLSYFNRNICFLDLSGILDNDKDGNFIQYYDKRDLDFWKNCYETDEKFQCLYAHHLRPSCLQQLNQMLHNISDEDFLKLGRDFDFFTHR